MRKIIFVAFAILLGIAVRVHASEMLAPAYSKEQLICIANTLYIEGGGIKARRRELVAMANSILNRVLTGSGWYRFVDWGGPDPCQVVHWRVGKRKQVCQYDGYCKRTNILAYFVKNFEKVMNTILGFPDDQYIPGVDLPKPVSDDELWKRCYEVADAVFNKGERAQGDMAGADTYQFWCLEPSAYDLSCEEGKRKDVKTSLKTKCWFALVLEMTETQFPIGERLHIYYRVKSPSRIYAELTDPDYILPVVCTGPDNPERGWYPAKYVADIREEQQYRLTHPEPTAPPKKPIVEPEERHSKKKRYADRGFDKPGGKARKGTLRDPISDKVKKLKEKRKKFLRRDGPKRKKDH